MTDRKRADLLLVERGLFESRAKAQAAIEAGLVIADGRKVAKASDAIATGAVVRASPAHPYVSRGGVKLAAALNAFAMDPAGCVCLDVGASTGGFTQVLLARGARFVYAVDVGREQLHPSLRARPEVVSLETTDIRTMDRSNLAARPEIVTVDVSFISLKLVLPPILDLASTSCRLVALIKPQFEAGREHLKKGIVRDPQIHETVCADIADHLRALGCEIDGLIPSPIHGGDGNREFLIAARRK